jgi:hypothetical protein
MTKTTDEVIDRFDRAFQERDATLFEDITCGSSAARSSRPPATQRPRRSSPPWRADR